MTRDKDRTNDITHYLPIELCNQKGICNQLNPLFQRSRTSCLFFGKIQILNMNNFLPVAQLGLPNLDVCFHSYSLLDIVSQIRQETLKGIFISLDVSSSHKDLNCVAVVKKRRNIIHINNLGPLDNFFSQIFNLNIAIVHLTRRSVNLS